MNSPEDHGSLDFDPDFAATLIGKYILVGVTVEDRRGEFSSPDQTAAGCAAFPEKVAEAAPPHSLG